jgi:hypothetical protein
MYCYDQIKWDKMDVSGYLCGANSQMMQYKRVSSGSQMPSLYACPVENVLGRVHLIPCYLNGNSTQPIQVLTASGVRFQRTLLQIQDPTMGQARGASCLNLKCRCSALGGPFFVDSLLSKLWTCAKRCQGTRSSSGAETLWRRHKENWEKKASAQ